MAPTWKRKSEETRSTAPADRFPRRTGGRYAARRAGVMLLLLAANAFGLVLPARHGLTGEGGATAEVANAFVRNGFFPLGEVMAAAGYRPLATAHAGWTKAGGIEIEVAFDFETNLCRKNQCRFDISGKWLESEGVYFIHRALVESVFNHSVEMTPDGKILATKITLPAHGWITAFQPLIAHAGGVYRTVRGNWTHTNSLAALRQNYEAGHRVFEIDFLITTDDKLAAAHDGVAPGNDGALAMSSQEWAAYKVMNYFQSAQLGDFLDEMLVNADMFLVTDTKTTDGKAFGIIREEAEKRDVALLDRVIPQIYNREMYDVVMDAYNFPSVIFTTYFTNETPMEIVEFCSGKDNIRVITTPAKNDSVDPVIAKMAAEKGILVYAHTLNSYRDISLYRRQGVYGLYSDFLTPADFALYNRISAAK